MKKAILVIIALIVVVGLILIFRGGANGSPSAVSALSGASATKGPITVNGWIFCMPGKTTSTLCLIGIEDASHDDYAILSAAGQPADPTQYTTGQPSVISGNLVDDAELTNNYNLAGVIQLK